MFRLGQSVPNVRSGPLQTALRDRTPRLFSAFHLFSSHSCETLEHLNRFANMAFVHKPPFPVELCTTEEAGNRGGLVFGESRSQ